MNKLIITVITLCMSSVAFAAPIIIVDGSTQGFYNDSLGQSLNGTNPIIDDGGTNTFLFPNNGSSPNDPTIGAAPAPDLGSVSTVLGDWLATPPTLNANWSGPQAIPSGWSVNSEVAVLYEITLASASILDVMIGVDNGVFAWFDGSYLGGQMAPGGASLGEFAGSLGPVGAGTHYLAVLLEDHGGGTGFQIRVTADAPQSVPEPGTLGLLTLGLLGLGFARRAQLKG